MNHIQDRIPLANGTAIPCVGFGTWKTPASQAAASVAAALAAGYRHIDTATAYHNEQAVGEAVAASGIPRGALFLTTKLWNPDQATVPRSPHATALSARWERIMWIFT